MKQFLYLFRGGDNDWTNESPEKMQSHMARWEKWMTEISQNNKPAIGMPLEPSGKVVRKAGKMITDGPYMDGKEIVGGYVIVEAKDLNHAVELSKGCPIFEFDGAVEVREAIDM